MQKPKLIVMVGLSASGKSTTAKQLADKYNAKIISSDAIREELTGDIENQDKNKEVFELFHKRIKETLLSGKNVIADATNLTIKSRQAILQNVMKISCIKEAYIIAKEIEDCISDNNKRNRIVPELVIRNQCKRFEIPFYEEGFNKIEIITNDSVKKNNNSIIDITHNMMTFDQHTPYHNETVGKHGLISSEHFALLNYPIHFKIAANYHDIGKLFTQTFDENNIAHYYNHENVGTYYLLTKLSNFNFTTKEALDFLFLINYHMKPFSWKEEKIHEKYRRIFGDEKYHLLLDFHKCDKIRLSPNYEKEDLEEEYE